MLLIFKTSTSLVKNQEPANVLNLQLDLVETRRQLMQSRQSLDTYKDKYDHFNEEYDKLKSDFRFFLERYGYLVRIKVRGKEECLILKHF